MRIFRFLRVFDCFFRHVVTSHHLKKKKKRKKRRGSDCFKLPRAPPPNPTTHHTIHSLFSLFGRSLSFLFSFSFSFLVNTTHRHTLLSLTLPPVHSSSSPLPFFRQITGKSSRTSHLHISYWGKSSNLFWWVLCSCLRLFYPSFNNDFHVI